MCHVLVLGPGWLTTRQGVLINHQLQPVLALWMLFCAARGAHTPSPCNNTHTRSLSLRHGKAVLTGSFCRQDPRHTMGKSAHSRGVVYIWNNAQSERVIQYLKEDCVRRPTRLVFILASGGMAWQRVCCVREMLWLQVQMFSQPTQHNSFSKLKSMS